MAIKVPVTKAIAEHEYRILRFSFDLSGTPGVIDITVQRRALAADGAVISDETVSHSVPEIRFKQMVGFAGFLNSIETFLYADFQTHRLPTL